MSNNRFLHDDYVYTYETEKKKKNFNPVILVLIRKKYNNTN